MSGQDHETVSLWSRGNYESYVHMFPIQCFLSSKLILSESRERSFPLNPFVSLLSPPFLQPCSYAASRDGQTQKEESLLL